jgi:hypothetical protein
MLLPSWSQVVALWPGHNHTMSVARLHTSLDLHAHTYTAKPPRQGATRPRSAHELTRPRPHAQARFSCHTTRGRLGLAFTRTTDAKAKPSWPIAVLARSRTPPAQPRHGLEPRLISASHTTSPVQREPAAIVSHDMDAEHAPTLWKPSPPAPARCSSRSPRQACAEPRWSWLVPAGIAAVLPSFAHSTDRP